MRALVVALLALLLSGCSALGVGPALQTADDVVRGACGAILATQGTPTQDVLAAFQEAEKKLVAIAAEKASQNASPLTVQVIQDALAANAVAMRELTRQLLVLAEKTTAPVGSPALVSPPAPLLGTGGGPPLPLLPPPAASVPLGAAPVSP